MPNDLLINQNMLISVIVNNIDFFLHYYSSYLLITVNISKTREIFVHAWMWYVKYILQNKT